MSNYFASEVGLTDATKKLWENKPEVVHYPMPEFSPKPYVKPVQDNKPAAKIKIKKRKKISQAALEEFQRNRLFAIIRNDGFQN